MILCSSRRARLHTYFRKFHTADHSIYVSDSTNAYFNLALEEWLFRKAPAEQPTLLIYRDASCVVIGRHQVPWKEVNMTTLRESAIPLVRRHSGGGTVYHDHGNTNFSIHTAHKDFERARSSQTVARAVSAMGVDDVSVNKRNDIVVAGKKVSGSAYRIAGKRAYHHGTMLISTDLSSLKGLLRSKREGLETRAIESVPSPVANLQRSTPGQLDHEHFVETLCESFTKEYLGGINVKPIIVTEEDGLREDFIRNAKETLMTWDWKYGQTPEFSQVMKKEFPFGQLSVIIKCNRGSIVSCDFESDVPLPEHLKENIVGQRYGQVAVDNSADDQTAAILSWVGEEAAK